MISIIAVPDVPIIKSEEQFFQFLKSSLGNIIEDNDIIVCAHTPWSRVRGPIYEIDKVEPSEKAIKLAADLDKDPKKIEIILQLSNEVIKVGRNVIITENKAGIVCANAGVDESNAGLGFALGVPEDSDALAQEIKQFISQNCEKKVSVIISDTVGRALRRGAVNIAIGTAGIPAMKSEIGKKDLFGYEMRVSEIAIADEIASAAELLQGQTDEASPIIIVRGYDINFEGPRSAKYLNRPKDERLFQ
ncbi:MAG: coenzyme F420-0:L-glutamate ligase [Candidatus Heimdallarchaeota archaeon]|nr:coenzyme F420-0:L-glutamate ligase [Candidatus Heimdallarchaeota archaeon]